MSAYIVSDNTINVIASAFIMNCVEFRSENFVSEPEVIIGFSNNGPKIASELLKANYDSVNYRYSEKNEPHEIKFELRKNDDFGTILGCIKCFNYQACEMPGWDDSEIKKSLDRLKNKIIEMILARHGYELPWGID